MQTDPAGFSPHEEPGLVGTIGPVVRRAALPGDPDGDLFRLILDERHLGPKGSVHGGVLMSLAEIVLGATVAQALDGADSTSVSLNCDFVGPAVHGEIVEGRARITRRTRSIVFVAGDLYVVGSGGNNRILMSATGIWKVLPQKAD